jgi:hypothetical protein
MKEEPSKNAEEPLETAEEPSKNAEELLEMAEELLDLHQQKNMRVKRYKGLPIELSFYTAEARRPAKHSAWDNCFYCLSRDVRCNKHQKGIYEDEIVEEVRKIAEGKPNLLGIELDTDFKLYFGSKRYW